MRNEAGPVTHCASPDPLARTRDRRIEKAREMETRFYREQTAERESTSTNRLAPAVRLPKFDAQK
ncbi:MAG TPA: hypothetical protein VN688_13865 [Gemmataceae bacterium]|nr:hypothetical protein [Gemmataceae bacterium]